ncbi:T9SS type A sorting domain-containing protein [candidate division TA06 bacterium]|nr:T9SS type A sorting domain-containing protein [candidate division TA06 bacterium]
MQRFFNRGPTVLSIIDDELIGTVYVLTVPFFDPGLGGVTILGDRVYVAANSEGLVVLDKTDPANLQALGTLDESSYFADVFFDGQYAYVAALGDGLIILDVLTNPNNPTIVGRFNPGDEIKDVKVQGNKAYLASDLTGMRVVDISNPMNPIEDTLYDSLGGVHNVTVSGNRAYLCTSANGVPMYILDITDPTNPTFLGSYYGGSSFIHDVFVENDTAYVSHWGLGLRIVDVTNPASPVEIGAYNYGGSRTHNAFLSGQYCYIEDEIIPGGFMRVVDVSDPTVPFEADSFIYSDSDPDGYAHNIYVQGNYAHISYASDGVVIADISDPLNPTLSGFYDMISYNWGVHPGSSYVYATDSHTGLWIFQFTPPPPGVEEENGESKVRDLKPTLSHLPNPTQNRVQINYSLPYPSEVLIKVYDLTGREVRNLVKDNLDAGSYSVEWNGKDDRGEKVSSGIYFVRLNAQFGQEEEFSETKKLIFLK